MIRVEMWLHPQGDASRKRFLGAATIGNDRTGNSDVGHYNVVLSKWTSAKAVWREGRVEFFPRQRLGPWDLLYRALSKLVGPRNLGDEDDQQLRWQQAPSQPEGTE